MAITINGNGTITGISVGGLPDGIVDTDMIAANAVATAKIADEAVTPAKRGEHGILQIKQNSNTTAQIANVTSTSWATSTDVPYVDITPVGANSLYLLDSQFYLDAGSSTVPCMSFALSTDGGSNWTYNIHMKGYPNPTSYSGTNGNNYGNFMSWGGLMGTDGTGGGDGIRHYSCLYKSSISAGAANIRFACCYRNVYHNSMTNAIAFSTATNPGCNMRVTEIRV